MCANSVLRANKPELLRRLARWGAQERPRVFVVAFERAVDDDREQVAAGLGRVPVADDPRVELGEHLDEPRHDVGGLLREIRAPPRKK